MADFEDVYTVTIDYETTSTYTWPTLLDATRYAVACAMHTGRRFSVHRVNGPKVSTQLFSVNPTTFDFRRVSPETRLVMKAIAHELVENIDAIAPKVANEGPER